MFSGRNPCLNGAVGFEGDFDFFGDGAFRMHRGFLAEVAHSSTGGNRDLWRRGAVWVGRFLPKENLEEGCFAATIAPNQAKFLPGGDGEGDVGKQLVCTIAFRQVGNRQDTHACVNPLPGGAGLPGYYRRPSARVQSQGANTASILMPDLILMLRIAFVGCRLVPARMWQWKIAVWTMSLSTS